MFDDMYAPKFPEHTDEELLRDHIAGVRGAFRELIHRHHRKLWWAIKRADVPREHHMDVFQEGLIRMHRFAANYNGTGRATVSTWITTIMRNAALTYMRKYGREAQPDEHEFTDRVRTVASPRGFREEATVERLDLHRCLRRLSPDLRAVITLTAYYGHSEQEVARQLGIPVGTVKSKKFRARAELQRHLGGVGEYQVAAAG
ncbi:RNA polymerase sigma factor [Corynebacterium falsenii]|uniref:RNA polymerase sigma factor n=1 Tax=Corynebacterium falsenii TaxID=108486 RepID=UPI001E0C358B|nr:sigma-70 family RNA polymerase sigma factor [Corynebacterium falsenii]HJF12830.1 sigma-70 family RNA polymerase sigma factor [Corynebacterium falsenii]